MGELHRDGERVGDVGLARLEAAEDLGDAAGRDAAVHEVVDVLGAGREPLVVLLDLIHADELAHAELLAGRVDDLAGLVVRDALDAREGVGARHGDLMRRGKPLLDEELHDHRVARGCCQPVAP